LRASGGSALLAVLWLSAALAAIAFSVANTVRGEMDRAATSMDGLRGYYLAVAGVERAAMEMTWMAQVRGLRVPPGVTMLPFSFPSGEVRVEIVPETAKLNINTVRPEELFRLLVALGVDDGRAREIALGVMHWRAPVSEAAGLDAYYLSVGPTFRARHASMEEIEELLLVRGVTPDIYHGTWAEERSAGGTRLARRPGLADCVSVFGATARVDVNAAPAPVLVAIGLPPDLAYAIVQRRRAAPFTKMEELGEVAGQAGPAAGRLRLGGDSFYTLRAEARPRLPDGRLSDLRRTVGALVGFMPSGYIPAVHYLRWYDTAWID
jgi:general secretion pathway protein K